METVSIYLVTGAHSLSCVWQMCTGTHTSRRPYGVAAANIRELIGHLLKMGVLDAPRTGLGDYKYFININLIFILTAEYSMNI